MPTRKRKITHGRIVHVFAERLRGQRLGHAMTQRELADRAHVTLSYVSKLEAGGVAPGIDLLERLAHALEIDVTDLLPSPAAPETTDAKKKRLKSTFDAVLTKAGHETLLMMDVFMTRLAESPSVGR